MQTAKASWILAMDDDDEYKPGALKVVRDVLRNGPEFRIFSEWIMASCRTRLENPTNEPWKRFDYLFCLPGGPGTARNLYPKIRRNFDFIEKNLFFLPDGPVWRENS